MGWAADACSAASSKSAMDGLGASSGCVCHSPIQCSPRVNSADRSGSALRGSSLTPPRPDQTAESPVASSTATRSPRRSLASNCPTLSRVCLRRCECRRNVFKTRGRNSSVHEASGMRTRTDASDIGCVFRRTCPSHPVNVTGASTIRPRSVPSWHLSYVRRNTHTPRCRKHSIALGGQS